MGKIKTKSVPKRQQLPSNSSTSLFGSTAQVDPALASLFTTSTTPKPAKKSGRKEGKKSKVSKEAENEEPPSFESPDEVDDEVLSFISSAEDEEEEEVENGIASGPSDTSADELDVSSAKKAPEKSRRKRKRNDEDLESRYMQRLADEEAREEAKLQGEQDPKRQKAVVGVGEVSDAVDSEEVDDDEAEKSSNAEDIAVLDVPKHETLIALSEDTDFDKAHRTVFLSNVSSHAITDKAAKKTLTKHMSSFLESLPADPKCPHKIESLRFRSTAFSNQLPKKAAFAKKEVMDATTKSTNVYIVYTTKVAAREALKRNGTVVLDRHVRVDSVAHPAKIDHHKCVFVGNLGFVDDESAIQAANEEEGARKQKKREPGDVEEGLWREFTKCGTVESVRVVRDAKTRVGKGIAYVQFTDENAVEAALQYNDKRFPPMLPRKLRVMRAKAIKRNAIKADSQRKSNGIYNPKITAQEKSAQGRAGKMLGRAGAAMLSKKDRSYGTGANAGPVHELKAPEDFVFEGHRAKAGSYTAGRKKSSVKRKRGGPPQNRESRRAAAWKKSGGKKE